MKQTIAGILLPAAACLFSSGCISPPEAEVYEDEVISAVELYEEATAILEEGRNSWVFKESDYLDSIDVFQEIIDNYPFSEYAILAELQIADSYFERDRFEEALSYYRDFAELHPTHERVPYSVLRSALSRRNQALNSNRDQTNTKRALEHLDVLLTRYPYTTEAQEAEQIWRSMRTRLAEHEMGVGDFYMSHEEFQSAADRFRKVLNDYPGLGLDGQALYKLGTCYSEMNLEDEATRIFEVILNNYDGTEYAEAAREHVPAAN